MRQAVMIPMLWTLLLIAFSAASNQLDETMDIVGQSGEPEPIADQPVDIMAKVVTGNSFGEDCLAPVTVTRIDGVKQAMPEKGFLIEPGIHSVNGRAVLDLAKCRPLDDGQEIVRAADLQVNFEPGNIYYIAYDHSPRDTTDWKLVVWKVEQVESPMAPNLSTDEYPPEDQEQNQP